MSNLPEEPQESLMPTREDYEHDTWMKTLRAERALFNPSSRAAFKELYGHAPEKTQ